jgi:hypothetical protein
LRHGTQDNEISLPRIRKKVRNIRWLYAINALLKAYRTKKIYARTLQRYAGKTVDETCLREKEKATRSFLAQIAPVDKSLNIFFLGTDEQQDRSGILQALERLGAVTYFTRKDESYGQNHPGSLTERRDSNTKRLLEIFRSLDLQLKVPDILIAQTWAGYVDPRAFGQIRQVYGTIVVNIAMDDRHQYWGPKVNGEWGGTYGLIPYIDLALTAAPECVDWYLKEGCPAIFFPEASDPKIFHPMAKLPKLYDISFVGGRYGVREKIVVTLKKAGIRVTPYGAGWENGRISTEEVPILFAQSKVVLGVGTIGHCSNFYALKLRDFDGPMSGSCYLTHDNPELSLLYDVGKEIVTYRTVDECIEKVKYYLEHESEREEIARAGYERAKRDHTWDKRFHSVFSLLGLAGSQRNPRHTQASGISHSDDRYGQ